MMHYVTFVSLLCMWPLITENKQSKSPPPPQSQLLPCLNMLETKGLSSVSETGLCILFMWRAKRSWLNLRRVHLMKRRAVNRLNVCVSGHILTLFSLPCLFFPIVRQILPNLINTGCSRLICAVTCSALCWHWKQHKGQGLSPLTSTFKNTHADCQ